MKDTDYTFGTQDDPSAGLNNRMQYRLTARAKIVLELEAGYPASDVAPGARGRELMCGIRDISASGLCLVSEEPLPVEGLFAAAVLLGAGAEPFALTVEVVWCRRHERKYLVGVRIIESEQTAYVEWIEAVADAMEAP